MINNNDKINESNLNNYESKTHFLSTHSTAFELIEFNSKILSIGCGNAHVEKKLISEKKCIVDGVDFIESKESKSLNKFLVVDLDKESIPLELKDYDYILLLDVIEHLKNPEKFLNQLNKKISKTSKLIVSTGNVAHIYIRIMLLLGNFNYTERGILDKTHTRLFTLNSFKKIIKDQNFDIEKMYFVPPPFPLVIKNKLVANFLLSISNFLNKISGRLFAFQFLLILKLREY